MIESPPAQHVGSQTKVDVRDFLRAVLGNFILLLLLVSAENLFFETGFYSSLIQHPFWIIVLIAAVHDGLFVGVLIAVAATFLMDWPTRPAEVDITAHYIQVAILPLQWLLAALCIGLFRQAELRRARAATAEMARLRLVNDVLAVDLMKIEAEMANTQLETLLNDQSLDASDDLFSRISALQEADILNIAPLFSAVAELCTALPVSILVKNTKGTFERLGVDHTGDRRYDEPRFNTEQMRLLRTMPQIVVPRTVPFESPPDHRVKVVVGVTSPDRRALHGAVEILVVDSHSADDATIIAQFLAIQLFPVLARIRMPTIAAGNTTDTKMQKNAR